MQGIFWNADGLARGFEINLSGLADKCDNSTSTLDSHLNEVKFNRCIATIWGEFWG
jgi:hypothetical protein